MRMPRGGWRSALMRGAILLGLCPALVTHTAAAAPTVAAPTLPARHGDALDAAPPTVSGRTTTRTNDGLVAASDHVIVRFQDTLSPGDRAAVHRAVASGMTGSAPQVLGQVDARTELVAVPASTSVDRLVAAYRADARVRYAQPDYVRYATDIPNDPDFAAQWNLAKVNAPGAWPLVGESPATTIAVLDCGIRETHPDLAGKVVLAKDFTNSNTGTDDRCNHGTHVAGIAAAVTNNGVGVAGTAPNAQLLNGKVLNDNGSGLDSSIAAGIDWAVENGARVINLSLSGWGACGTTPLLQDAITAAWSKNVVVVVAAGNNGVSDLQTPGSCANVVSVASTNNADARSSFSDFGSWVTVAAPGESILSTVNPDLNDGSAYAYFDGTSMATPLVSGIVAMLWATRYGTSAAAVVNRLETTVDPIPGTGTAWRYGRVNAATALSVPPAPVATRLAPATVPSGSGDLTLAVTGANFASGAAIHWGGASRPTTVHSATTVTATIAAADLAQAGSIDITVVNPDGQATAPLSFVVSAGTPTLRAVSPDTAGIAGGQAVTVQGANFQQGATVSIGNVPVTAVTVVDTTKITCVVPAGAAGTADVTVVNPGGLRATLAAAFHYTPRAPAAVASVSPSAVAGPHATASPVSPAATPLPAPARH